LKEAEFFFLGAILYYSQSGDDPQEDLAKFGYKLNTKAIYKKNVLCVLLATYLNHMQTDVWLFFFNFDRILAIKIFRKHMILALSQFLV
jgi:hypothetical protein